VRCYSVPGALRAGLAYYRAIPQDISDNQAAIREGGKLKMPVFALGGAESFCRGMLVRESMTRLAENVAGGVIEGTGHWIAEEQPEKLLKHLLEFFAG